MKIKSRSTFFKLPLLFLGILFTFWTCQTEDDIIEENQVELKLETVSKSAAVSAFNEFKENNIPSDGFFSRLELQLEITPDWNTFKQEELDFTDALLSLVDIETNAITDLKSELIFIKINEELVQVIETREKIERNQSNENSEYIYFHQLNGRFIVGYELVEGRVVKALVAKEELNESGFISMLDFFVQNCQEFPSSITCLNTLEEVIITANVNTEASPYYYFVGGGRTGYGDNSNNSNPDDGGGGGSGNGGNDSSGNDNEEDTTCSGNREYDARTGTCECKYGYTEDSNGVCVDDKIDTSNLTGKANCVYQKMVDDNNNINWILSSFRDRNEPSEFNLRFEMSTSLGSETNASTVKSGNTFIIKINQNRAENINTVLTIARTIIHEGIHARLREFAVREGSNETSFPGVYDYFRRFKKNWDHQQMAEHYRSTIAEGLKEYDNGQHSDSFYNALAWEGLSEIKDLNGNHDKIYTEAWKKLSTAEQQLVLNIIIEEKQNGNKICQ
jgi:hypothetical protein